MNKILILFMFLMSYTLYAQEKYITKSGVLTFEASVPSFEEVKAKNELTTAILNTNNGEIAALVLVKGFRFKNALMEEHFNENYAESELYPKSTFKGVIKDFTEIDFVNLKIQKIIIEGILDFHGQSKQVSINKATISKNGNDIIIEGLFMVNASDFKIEIPNIVSNKLSNEVQVTFNFGLSMR